MLNLLFPLLCNGCAKPLKKQEIVLCVNCRHRLSIACYHRSSDDSLKRVFYGRTELEEATALLEFQKEGISQKLIHNLKYKRQEQVSSFLGEWLGAELKECAGFLGIDMVIPVPIHPSKKRRRGYNQVSGFGRAIAKHLNIPFREDILLKHKSTVTQVLKTRARRFEPDMGMYVSASGAVSGKHVLLVDDIVTTGATVESCADILKADGLAKLSLAVMAKA